MAGIQGNPSPSWKLISGFLNGEDLALPGVPLASPSGSIVSAYGGFLGTEVRYSADQAGLASGPAGTCFGGIYKYVKTSATLPNPSRGRLVFWDLSVAEDQYQVCQDETQNGGFPLFAGVLLNTVTPGNYTIIQIAGRMTVKCRAAVTAGTRNLSWAAAGAGADNATFDGLANAVSIQTVGTASMHGAFMAIGEAVAANGALITADSRAEGWYSRS